MFPVDRIFTTTDLVGYFGFISKRIHEVDWPVLITQDGRPAYALLAVDFFQKLMDRQKAATHTETESLT